MALKLGTGHLVKAQDALETTTFSEFLDAWYGEQFNDDEFVPEIDYTLSEEENGKQQGYFTFWKDVDGNKYRQYIGVTKKISTEAGNFDDFLEELGNNYPIYVSHMSRERVDEFGIKHEARQLEVPTLTFSIKGERKAKPVSLKGRKLGEKVSGLPAPAMAAAGAPADKPKGNGKKGN